MMKYVAFLRGINSGKNPAIKMEALKKAFENIGFKNVKAVLASGNIVFEAEPTDEAGLEKTIEKALPGAIGFESDTVVLTIDELSKLFLLNPFKNIKITPRTRLYVTFLKDRPETNLKFPVERKGYIILEIYNAVVLSTVDLSIARTPDLMQALDKEFGKGNTTRNWNTIEKILKAAGC